MMSKICIIGSGNWGSTIAKIIGHNVKKYDEFDNAVRMWVFDEVINGEKLTKIINTMHENVKYLKGHKLPENVVAVPVVAEAAEGADIYVFVLPHQHIAKVCQQLKGSLKKNAVAVSLIKGLDVPEEGGLRLISDVIRQNLGVPCHVLMGANVASEVAAEEFCEATLGCTAEALSVGAQLKRMFQADYFRITVVKDAPAVEMCGALKNIVALGAGFVDGLGLGGNTKAAVIRLGLVEMLAFCRETYPETKFNTLMESCGVADLITTCYGGRNWKLAKARVKTGKPFAELESEMLDGQSLQGPLTAADVNAILKGKKILDKFPLFAAVHKISTGQAEAGHLLTCLKSHPAHM